MDSIVITPFEEESPVAQVSLDKTFNDLLAKCREVFSDPKLTLENFGVLDYFFFRRDSTLIEDRGFGEIDIPLRKFGIEAGRWQLCYVPKR